MSWKVWSTWLSIWFEFTLRIANRMCCTLAQDIFSYWSTEILATHIFMHDIKTTFKVSARFLIDWEWIDSSNAKRLWPTWFRFEERNYWFGCCRLLIQHTDRSHWSQKTDTPKRKFYISPKNLSVNKENIKLQHFTRRVKFANHVTLTQTCIMSIANDRIVTTSWITFLMMFELTNCFMISLLRSTFCLK